MKLRKNKDLVAATFDDADAEQLVKKALKNAKKRKEDDEDEGSAYEVDPAIQALLDMDLQDPKMPTDTKRNDHSHDQLAKDIEQIQLWRKKPLLFWRDALGISIEQWRQDYPPPYHKQGMALPLWSKQRDIIEALVKYKRVAVKSGHGSGKSMLAAGAALYFGVAWKAIVITTAPSMRQVKNVLWGEIHSQYHNAIKPLGGTLNQVRLDFGPKWFMEGFSTDKPTEKITGVHEECVVVIIDEAGGVAPDTFDALEGILSSENCYELLIGNPVVASGPFLEAFKPNSGFKPFTISCYDTPNVKHKKIIYPKLTSYAWVKDKEKKWGVDSNMFRVRVLGEFPEEDKNTLVAMKYIEQALERGRNNEFPEDSIVAFGLDVARAGTDFSQYGVRWKSGKFKIVASEGTQKVPECAGKMKFIYDQMVPRQDAVIAQLDGKAQVLPVDEEKPEEKELFLPIINVDDVGVGGGVTDLLEEADYPVNGINVSAPPDSDDEDAKYFLNKRAQLYWRVRKAFLDGKISIDDEELAYELSKIQLDKFTSGGKIKIIDKELIKKEMNGRSPDRAESLMLTFASNEEMMSRDLVRFI